MRPLLSKLLPAVVVLATGCATRKTGHTTLNSLKTTPMTQTTSAESLKSFFAAFGQGDLEGVIATFHPGAHIQAVRGSTRRPGEVYGTYDGRAGAREFITNLGATFDTQAFEVKRLGADGELAFAEGSFVHRVKASGKLFRSDWSLVCVIEDGKIREYRFYEDSAALAQAQ